MQEKHIFEDSEDIFSEKIHSFHNSFVNCSLLTGISSPGTSIDKVPMSKNPKFTLLYYQRIIGGLLENEPLIKILSINNNEVTANCGVYYLNNNKDIKDLFYRQDISNWEKTSKTCFQVWKLKKIDILKLNKHWI